jgi:hypothetical protein
MAKTPMTAAERQELERARNRRARQAVLGLKDFAINAVGLGEATGTVAAGHFECDVQPGQMGYRRSVIHRRRAIDLAARATRYHGDHV